MDSEAWESFDRTYRGYLIEKARAAGLSREDAEDVAQETLVCVWAGLPLFRYDRDRCRFRTWVRQILHDRVVDQYRRSGRQPPMAAPDDGTGTPALQRLADPAARPAGSEVDAEWERNLLRAARERVEKRFSQREWQIFQYLETHEMDTRLTARDLGVSAARVYVAKNRVQREIKKELVRLHKELY